MTITTLITLNAILAAIVVYGIVWLLIAGIRSDARLRAEHRSALRSVHRARDRDRIAA